ncbi:MAG: MFS transporter [Patescibacteria group bacterium]
MKSFFNLLGNSLIAVVTNFLVWSTVVYWVYLTTGSVLGTSIMSGMYLVLVMVSGFWLGSIVDHNKKKTAMLISSFATLFFFACALLMYSVSPKESFTTVESVRLWVVVAFLLFGVIAGNIRSIALPTAVPLLVPEEKRDRANGMTGTIMGIAFALSNVGAGFGYAYIGISGVLSIALGATVIAILHLLYISIPEPEKVAPEVHEVPKSKLDIKGTIAIVRSIPGLFPLILFTTFNNFLGGVFMSLMDPYGLTLVSVQVWGTLWGFLSCGFIIGGLVIAKRGLGKNPVRTLFVVNGIIWTISIFMTIQHSIVLLGVCMFIYLCMFPFIEASEQTVMQKVVPQERLGRVFGFAQSVEQSASPITAFVIGPVAQFIFIPFMTTGVGVELIGSWYGVGVGRGLGLVFTLAGIIGLVATIIAARSRSAKMLSTQFKN